MLQHSSDCENNQPVHACPNGCKSPNKTHPKTFNSLAALRQHIDTIHSITGHQKFKCPEPGCNYEAHQNSNVKRHLIGQHKWAEENATKTLGIQPRRRRSEISE